MNQKARIAALAGMAGLTAGAAAQDSLGSINDAYSTSEQRTAYVLDLVGTTTSWGNVFGVGPLVKSPTVPGSAFANNLISANAVSQTFLNNVAYPSALYALWENELAGGTGPGEINTLIAPPGATGTQFAATFADFGPLGTRYNGVTTAVVNFDPADPARLYITRVQAAVNGPDPSTDNSQFGIGGVDASGNTFMRSDAFGTNGGANALTGNNYFRIDALGRNPAQTNHISAILGDRDLSATAHILQNSPISHTTPTGIPSERDSSRVLIGASFAPVAGAPGEYVRGSSFPPVANTDHINGTGVTDTRGGVTYSPARFIPNSLGTAAILARGPADGNEVFSVAMWDLGPGGSVLRNAVMTRSASAVDPVDPYTPVLPIGRLDGYRSQVAARGGNAPVAIGYNPYGNFGVVAAVSYDSPSVFADDPLNTLLVGHFDPADPTGTVSWVVAGWFDGLQGKPIKDGPGGNVIGRLTTLDVVTGGAPRGPSISAPAIDAAGNIWFVGAAEQFKTDAQGNPFIDNDSILIRAVWDPATGGYELERILEPGFTRTGLNSGVEYTLTFLGIADSNSIDSSTLFSNGVNQSAWNNVNPTDYTNQDPRTVGGVVLAVQLTYLSAVNYQCLLYVGNITPADATGCQADLSGSSDPNDPAYGVPDGVVDAADFFYYLDQFVAGNIAVADLTGSSDPNDPAYGIPDGVIDAADFFYFLDIFVAGCP
ncbi:MAG: hypothetical protein KF866_03315 [Phycisphaeraceae bacterium]|nr:hypothetical protein [Phycisphaeraceae bacterium]MCW5753274.1 hypothetical protein [Phycisphaeraceae bacterium]